MFFGGATAALTLLFCPQIKGATMHSWLNLERSPLNRKPTPTLPETNMFAPKNGGFQYQSPFPGGPHFQGRTVSFRVGNVDCLSPIPGTSTKKHIKSSNSAGKGQIPHNLWSSWSTQSSSKYSQSFCYTINGSLNCWCASCILFETKTLIEYT